MSDDDQTQAAERVGLMATNAALLRDLEDLCQQRDEARAQAVQATTDLRARLIALAEAWEAYGTVPGQPSREVRAALEAPSRAGTAPVSASSASVDPSATPDLLGPQIGAESLRPRADLYAALSLSRAVDALDRVREAIAPWPPGPRKGDVYRALGEDR